ncbi:MAG: DUF4338 domain-containing protein [Rhodobacteraceae bacterium]|nr:DUF4338 domain-containing protein [Paracoccaceae bacterium]
MIDLSRLSAIPVARREEQRFRDLLDAHHYLGAGPKIGETIWYAADDGSGAWPALAAFSAAALKCTARDDWIGWSPRDRFGRLHQPGADLATLTLNEVAIPARRAYRFPLMSEPTPLQIRAFQLMEVDPARFVPSTSTA